MTDLNVLTNCIGKLARNVDVLCPELEVNEASGIRTLLHVFLLSYLCNDVPVFQKIIEMYLQRMDTLIPK